MKAPIESSKNLFCSAIPRANTCPGDPTGPPGGEAGEPEPQLSDDEVAALFCDTVVPEEEPTAASSPAPETEPAVPEGPAIRLFDPAAVRKDGSVDSRPLFEEDDERGHLLAEMATDAAGGYRALVVPLAQQVEALRALEETAPHLAAVIGIVADAAGAAVRRGCGFSCPPLLIAGPPGVGKTRLVTAMTDALNLPLIFLDGSAMDDTAALAGHSRSWRASRPGTVAKALIRGKVANLVLVIDEIDKVDADRRYGPTTWHVLHGLLEPETARRWQDACLELPMDMSRLVVMATANDLRDIPASLVDRFLVITVDAPGDSDLAALIQAVSDGVAAGFGVTGIRLASDVLPLLSGLPPRRLRTVLQLSWARALAAGRDRPGEADIRHAVRIADAARRQPIGFMADK
jgi:ATP-dependent Lon protease